MDSRYTKEEKAIIESLKLSICTNTDDEMWESWVIALSNIVYRVQNRRRESTYVYAKDEDGKDIVEQHGPISIKFVTHPYCYE